jgi:hypothetical protein
MGLLDKTPELLDLDLNVGDVTEKGPAVHAIGW